MLRGSRSKANTRSRSLSRPKPSPVLPIVLCVKYQSASVSLLHLCNLTGCCQAEWSEFIGFREVKIAEKVWNDMKYEWSQRHLSQSLSSSFEFRSSDSLEFSWQWCQGHEGVVWLDLELNAFRYHHHHHHRQYKDITNAEGQTLWDWTRN